MPDSTTYGKQNLVDDLMRNAGLTRTQAQAAVDTTINLIQEQVQAGNRVTLPGFGTWQRTERAARVGTNPQTREKINIPAQTSVRFSPGSTFKSNVGGATSRVNTPGYSREKSGPRR
jgi:nucleoid DNA-binding protein